MSGILYKPSGNQQRPLLTNIKVELGDYLDYDPGSGNVIDPIDDAADLAGGFVLDYEVDNSGGSAGDKKVLIDSGGAIAYMQQQLANPSAGGTYTLSGAAGQVDTIVADGVEILEGAEAFDTDLTTTAANVARKINRNNTRFYATSAAAVVTVRERVVTKSAWTASGSASGGMGVVGVAASGGEAVEVGNVGVDVFAVSRREVALSGTRAMGEVYRVLDDDDEVVEATAAKGSIEVDGTSGSITQIQAGATNLFASPVVWATSNENTAGLVRDEINLGIGTHGYFASVDGAEVTIWQTTATLNESSVALTATGSPIVNILENIRGGSKPRILVRAKKWGE